VKASNCRVVADKNALTNSDEAVGHGGNWRRCHYIKEKPGGTYDHALTGSRTFPEASDGRGPQ